MAFISRAVEMVKRTGKPHIIFWSPAGAWVRFPVANCSYRYHSPRSLPKHIVELDARASHFCRIQNKRRNP